MNKKIAILQSNYIPWKGYFDIINSVDEFVLYDDVQYTRRDWRNRNKIKTIHGLLWLSIPVSVKGRYLQSIYETKISSSDWAGKHWNTLRQFYRESTYFSMYEALFRELYTNRLSNIESLSEINYLLITEINRILGIDTTISWSNEYAVTSGKNEQLIGICKESGANIYLSGPAARGYIDESIFQKEGVSVEWIDYAAYPEYPQLHGDFIHGVTILDLIFNVGPNAPVYMKSFKNQI